MCRAWCIALGIAILATASAAGLGAPARPAVGTAIAVAAGDSHTCLLTAGGGVRCWGWNASGQVGDGTDAYIRSRPSSVSGLSSGVGGIAAGNDNGCAVTRAGGVECWGLNMSGQLGNGSTVDQSSVPVRVIGLSSGVRSVSVGNAFACALLTSERVKCWGSNDSGQLGDGTTTDRPAPVFVSRLSGVRAVAAGADSTCALLSSGLVKCWGSNVNGELGNGSVGDSARLVTVARVRHVEQIAVGLDEGCALVRGGRVYCWGGEHANPVRVPGLSGVRSIGAGFAFACAVTSGRAVECWGSNEYGKLGDGSRVSRDRPVKVQALVGSARAVVAGQDHVCALTTRGWIECWGRNDFGQLGDGTTDRSFTPMGVVGFGAGRLPGCAVPNVKGLPFTRARTEIAKHACQLRSAQFAHSSAKFGRVIYQRPRGGTRLPRGGMVALVLSRG